MKDWQKRVVIEEGEMRLRVSKLSLFIDSKKFIVLESYNKELLKKQLRHMKVYQRVLMERIEEFESDEG